MNQINDFLLIIIYKNLSYIIYIFLLFNRCVSITKQNIVYPL